MKSHNLRRGSVILLALVVAFIMMSWAVAATFRANFMTGALLYSYRRSEAYYLAKRGISRSLYFLNKKNSWGTTHNSRANADTTTDNTKCWLDTSAAVPMLRCEATSGGQVQALSVPLLKQGPSDTRLYMVSPSVGSGPAVISWATETGLGDALPNIPNSPNIGSVAGTPNGDVYALAGQGTTRNLWRYRLGQGWQQMPDVPGGVNLFDLTACGDQQLVCRGSDNKLKILPLGSSSTAPPMDWTSVDAPSGSTLYQVCANPSNSRFTYATLAKGNGDAAVFQHDGNSGLWAEFASPAPPAGLNFAGGLTADKNGQVFVACNPTGGPAMIYKNAPAAPGDTSALWTLLDPVPMFDYGSPNSIQYNDVWVVAVENLKADNEGHVWSQYINPTTSKTMSVRINDVPTPGVVNPGPSAPPAP